MKHGRKKLRKTIEYGKAIHVHGLKRLIWNCGNGNLTKVMNRFSAISIKMQTQFLKEIGKNFKLILKHKKLRWVKQFLTVTTKQQKLLEVSPCPISGYVTEPQ